MTESSPNVVRCFDKVHDESAIVVECPANDRVFVLKIVRCFDNVFDDSSTKIETSDNIVEDLANDVRP